MRMITVVFLLVLVSVCVAYSGYGTHFDGIGSPYGGCGLPESALPTSNYIALNVQKTPGDYKTYYPRPIADPSKVGLWDNGRNCGLWVRIVLGDNCVGASNSGNPGTGFCRGGNWVADQYNGAQLDLMVTDSCQDGNEWCRDDPYHLDIHTSSLQHFVKDGREIGAGVLNGWNNRKITWDWVAAPHYQGDVWIGFRQAAEPQYYPAIAISNLPHGVYAVQRNMGGSWHNASMISDNGQAFVLPSGSPPYTIRILSVSGTYSRSYTFNFPSECGGKCTAPFTKVSYSTEPLIF